MSATFVDLFCGAGGSSTGLVQAGFELKLAANHWQTAIDSHAANHPDAEHLCTDIDHYDMRRLPKAEVLWASPICTEMSPAGGTSNYARRYAKKNRAGSGQDMMALEELGHIPQPGYERTRATFHDVIRATEIHRYDVVMVENVVDVVSKWELFDWWLQGMLLLGYEVTFVSASSAHLYSADALPAPQWRDRLYLVFTRKGMRKPDLRPRPWAWCFTCEKVVQAVQSWIKPGTRVGKYGQQYLYRCPNSECRHDIVEPYVLPAAAAIDWTDLGDKVSDRVGSRALASNTIRRIEAGLQMFAQPTLVAAHGNTWERPGSGYVRAWPALDAPLNARTGTPGDGIAIPPVLVSVNHGGDDHRAYLPDSRPLGSRTTKVGEGLVMAPGAIPPGAFYVKNYGGASEAGYRSHPADLTPLGTITTSDSHSLVVPLITTARRHSRPHPADGDAVDTVTAGGNHHELLTPPGAQLPTVSGVRMVIPFRRKGRAHRAGDEPFSTVATRPTHAVAVSGINVGDCRFRMLSPREHLAAQGFPGRYIVHGNKAEQTAQAGNAVSVNASRWLGGRVAAVLG